MRYRRLILAALLMAAPFAANAEHIGARISNEMNCSDGERRLVSVVIYQRGQGVAKEKLLANIANFAPEERLIAEYRIEDVYLDPTLTANTITAYRMQRCLRHFERHNYLQFNDVTREHLLRCQNGSAYGSRAFARCIDDLMHVLEDKANKAAETP